MNFKRFKMMGGRLLLQKGVRPHKFECQGRSLVRVRAAAAKRDQQRNLVEAFSSSEVEVREDFLNTCRYSGLSHLHRYRGVVDNPPKISVTMIE